MNQKLVAILGIAGVSLFAFWSIVGGLLIEGYDPMSQFISETYAVDTEYGWLIRSAGFIPSGFMIAIYCILGQWYLQPKRITRIGFIIVGICYGLATVFISFFPCDSGCNKEWIDPSMSQILHNLIGMITYLLVPLGMILVGMGLRKAARLPKFATPSIALGIVSYLFVAVMVTGIDSPYLGLFQRIIEASFAIWIIWSALGLYKLPPKT